nr:hypothetical protein [Tanacetum cinerariifolium]
MVADLRYFNSLESEVNSLRSQLETQKTQFLNEIDRLSREYYYVDHMNAILGVYTELDEVTNLQCDCLELLEKCEVLETELSKSKMMSKSFESVHKHVINLELELQQYKEKIKNDMLFKVNKSKDFCKEREQYFEIQDLKAQLQDKGIVISELKKLNEKLKGKSMDTKFEKSSVIRQPNAFKRVILTTSVSRPSLKSNPQGDRVMHNNSHRKKQEVEDHRRSVKLSKNKTSVTAFASESNKKPINFTRKLYECVSKTCSWWYPKFTPSGYKWKPKSGKANVNSNLVEIVLFIVDSGCSKHMTGNLKLLINFVEKFLGTIKFWNDQIAPILGYEDLVQGSTMALNHESLSPAIQRQENVTQADRTVTTSKELDLLFSQMFDELLNGSSKVVSKSSAMTSLSTYSLPRYKTKGRRRHVMLIRQICTLSINDIHLNIVGQKKAETYAENAQVTDDKFINIFSTPVQDQGETSSCHVDSSNMHTFYQRYTSEHRWTKDHPLEQVIGNPSQSVRTRRQLESGVEMCMFALTEELHQFDQLDVWELIDRPLCTNVINLKWLRKNKRDEE